MLIYWNSKASKHSCVSNGALKTALVTTQVTFILYRIIHVKSKINNGVSYEMIYATDYHTQVNALLLRY